MMIHEITEKVGRHKSRKRIGRGRGSGHGKTSGRGHKGAGSRAGYKYHVHKEGGQLPYFRRIPKRGFTNNAFRTLYHVVNVSQLNDRFKDGDAVDAASLVAAGLIRDTQRPVKILGNGELKVKVNVTAAKLSASAQAKIEGLGGSVTINAPKKWVRVRPDKASKTPAAKGGSDTPASDD